MSVPLTAASFAILLGTQADTQDAVLPLFERHELSTTFFGEGAAYGDLDGDGANDIVSGPHWYAGPSYTERFTLYEAKPFDPLKYSDFFFAWTRDLDGDSDVDVFAVGFPGQASFWLENPGDPRAEGAAWTRHLAFPSVNNESPWYTDLVGDDAPELVGMLGGAIGYAQPDPDDPRAPWRFTKVTGRLQDGPFIHGLGVGDIDGDGRRDVLWKHGWFRQPEVLGDLWERHDFDFAGGGYGGAQMLVFDVNGDGRNDVVTSLNAHAFGLAWFEQGPDGSFERHDVIGATQQDNATGWRITEMHALALADVDGDGIDDVVTGKRYWSHGPGGEPGSDDPADLVWLKTVRDGDGAARLVVNVIDCDSGVGTQVTAGDIDGDGATDVLVGNKKGTHVFLQRDGGSRPTAPDGRALNFGFESGDLADWRVEGDAFLGQPVTGGTVTARGREPARFAGDHWIGGYELHGDGPTGRMVSAPFRANAPYASFLIGGGSGEGTRVELAVVGSEHPFFTAHGNNSETMGRVIADLGDVASELIEIRVIDEATGGWGHVNFDDFRLHATRPRFPTDPRLPVILPADPVLNAGLSPTAAVHAMTVPDGFRVSLIASEPELTQPIQFVFDPRGRIWVVEAHSYPRKRPDGAGADRILVFEDKDRNGSFESRTVFADGLNLVSGIEVGYGGVFVGQAPELLFLPDADDDLVPDGPAQVLLDGFGYQDTHETLNAFTWGPDGWLYGCHGVFTHSRVGRPGTPDDERVGLNAGVWRYHPTERLFEVFAEGTSNPWGVDFDRHGEAFITACVIPHLFHLSQGGRYERQAGNHFNPHTYDDIKTIADHRHYLGSSPHGGNGRSSAAGGGHAHCGAMIYQADVFPAEWRGRIFMSNIHGNRINTDILEPNGSGYVGRHGEDFLLSNDSWFRAVAMKTGPDGAMYVIDWYDEQACHHNDVGIWNRENGRMYRVSYGAPIAVAADLPDRGDAELARMQLHANEWFARRARMLLQERGASPAAVEVLVPILLNHDDEAMRLRALWTMHAMRAMTPELVERVWSDRSEHVRAWLVRLSAEPLWSGGDLAARPRVLDDTSPVVQRALLGVAAHTGATWIAESLATRIDDTGDPNLAHLLWYGLEPMVARDPEAALALALEIRIPFVARSIARRAGASPDALDALIGALGRTDDPAVRTWMLEATEEALSGQRDLALPPSWPATYDRLSADAPALQQRLDALAIAFGDVASFPAMRRILAEASAPATDRLLALDALVRGRDRESVPILQSLVRDTALGGPVLRALANFDHPETPARVLASYPSLDGDARRDARNTLSSRPAWARALLEAVRDGVVPRTDLGAFVIRQVHAHGDPELDALVAEVWGAVRASTDDKIARIAELKSAIAADGTAPDLAHGRALFAKNCGQCHALFDHMPPGGEVGPELTGSNRADVDYLLHNMVDPSAEVGRDYQATTAWLLDGRIVTGILREETDSAIVLQAENETHVIARSELEEALPSELSMMPDGLLDALSAEEIRDLLAYLAGPAQVPRLLLPGEESKIFDGASLLGWTGDPALWSVEDGAIVGRAPDGIGHNAFLRSTWMLRDFRLRLQVMLVDDEGNSGIQFRSRELEGGDVEGYQADIGPGWWGKLYEEHGRALLVDLGAGEHVRKGEWNDYEITAVGARVTLRVNGVLCADLDDPDGAREGILALQVHSGGPTEVRFRELRLELPPFQDD